MKNNVKLLALLLSLLVIVSLFALPVFASADEPVDNTADGAVSGEAGNEGGENEGAENNAAPGKIEINFDMSRFVDSLQYMWKGMLCIFIVIGVIILITYFFNRAVNYFVFASEEKKRLKESENSEN